MGLRRRPGIFKCQLPNRRLQLRDDGERNLREDGERTLDDSDAFKKLGKETQRTHQHHQRPDSLQSILQPRRSSNRALNITENCKWNQYPCRRQARTSTPNNHLRKPRPSFTVEVLCPLQ